MKRHWFRWWWLLFLIPIATGLARLHFDVEVLDLLPADVSAVQGLKIYQQHFANARELIITVQAPNSELAESTAKSVAETLRRETNLIAAAIWQPPWLEHPDQTAELVAYLWLNQPPEKFAQLANRLSETNLANVLASTREQLSTTLSPDDIAHLSYDPLGLTRLPQNVARATTGFGQGQDLFTSADGTFRIVFVKARGELRGYRECADWFNAVKNSVNAALPDSQVKIGYTGRAVFTAEISGGMKHDITISVGGTALIIAILFWLAHRRIKPMVWLLILLALILAATLALGGLIFGAINVVSMGFAAILLGLAVDYAVVHYQEALAHPHLTIPRIRRSIAPAIFWAAVTTISAFLVLNLGGLPGLAQLGTLVAIGVALSACVMIFAFLPPLFPNRMPFKHHHLSLHEAISLAPELIEGKIKHSPPRIVSTISPLRTKITFALTAILILFCAAILFSGVPQMDETANPLRPRHSQAYDTADAIAKNLNQKREPLWLVIGGTNENDVAQKLDAIKPILQNAVSNQTLAQFNLPDSLWPRPQFQNENRPTAQRLVAERNVLRAAVLTNGFSENALGLSDGILNTWQRAGATTNVFWPTNQLSQWIFEKIASRGAQGTFAVGFLFPATNATANSLARLNSQLPQKNIWLSGWELLGGTVLTAVKKNLWKLLLPMIALILTSLWLAFRRFTEIFLSLAILLLSGFCLLAAMRVAGWSWNLLNLMALPLILGTGVDYSIFMQLALRRYNGDVQFAHRAVGRALLLCGGTAISGFGSLGFSTNAGMASLGRVCAVGIAGNMLISIFLLPVWWKLFSPKSKVQSPKSNGASKLETPSKFYRGKFWQLGLMLARFLPVSISAVIAKISAAIYCRFASRRRKIVVQNLLPIFNGDRKSAERAARELFSQFALKLADLWRFESGVTEKNWFTDWNGWEHFAAANARGKGVLLVTPHLGNWEFGGAFLVKQGVKVLVLTQAEPDEKLAVLRQNSRARRGVETLVVGKDAFAFVEIIKRLQEGATVALLVDRPPAPTAVNVELFGKKFPASIAAAELARASGCAILPGIIVRKPGGYFAQILPEIIYDRAAIADRAERIKLTEKIMRAFEPLIRQYATQWYHFVTVWPEEKL